MMAAVGTLVAGIYHDINHSYAIWFIAAILFLFGVYKVSRIRLMSVPED